MLLGELVLAADPVHDLEGVGPDRLDDEGEELERLPLEAQREEPPEHEGRVADPGEAVVPVALPAGRLRQRRRGRRHHGAGGRVAQSLERERAALEVTPPGMVREGPALQPLAPRLGGVPDLVGRLLRCGGRSLVIPGQRGEGALALTQRRPSGRARSGERRAEGSWPVEARDRRRAPRPWRRRSPRPHSSRRLVRVRSRTWAGS